MNDNREIKSMTPREALYHLSMALGPVAHTDRDDNLSYTESTLRDAMTTLQEWVDADLLPSEDLFEIGEPAKASRPYNSIEPEKTFEVHDLGDSIDEDVLYYRAARSQRRSELSTLDWDDVWDGDGTAGSEESDSIHPITNALPLYGLIENIIEWHYDRNLIHGSTDKDQFCKLIQECGELSDNLCKGNDIKDDIGDIMVVLLNIAERNGVCLAECLNVAYDDIKDRKGLMVDGVFVKYDES